MEDIADFGMEEYDGNGFFNSESFLESYFSKRIEFFGDNLILNDFNLFNYHFFDYFNLSDFDLINLYMINDFKSCLSNSKDSNLYSYDSLDDLF